MNWQPIETAPKDGGPFLILYARRIFRNQNGDTVSFGAVRDYAEIIDVAWAEDGDIFEQGTAHSVWEDWRDVELWPTHWMPLPPPPPTKE